MKIISNALKKYQRWGRTAFLVIFWYFKLARERVSGIIEEVWGVVFKFKAIPIMILRPRPILIATLGSEPQVVTAGLDLLLADGVGIRHVEVVHTTAPGTPIDDALSRLKAAAADYTNPSISFSFFALEEDGRPFADTESRAAGEAVLRLIYRRIAHAKHEGETVHLLIAGGRKTMSIYGMVAAQMLFDEEDRLWHLYSAGDFLTSKRLHPRRGDAVQLAPIPVVRWGELSPAWLNLRGIADPWAALEAIRRLQLERRREDIHRFLMEKLTPAERQVVEMLVTTGWSDREIAAQLYLSPRTVEQHLRAAYGKAAGHWGMESVNRTQLVALLQLYFADKLGENPHDNSA
ncbi:MAG: CRISPR-associated ring nuclease [Chloroflexota bacterium]